ncbi:RagB/SusD family nutrient uptake outer membrane protein [Pedobacter aquatilis]|uniref:RagB/SusD family nutrient uptake outer membrane protein n=1 Tax=Pedobacter aquatilis TaxID=351343 RepID=UPI00292E68DC|nr:RagB/SusD family nutrient uptake outer membrane protein [Pedobacter aquatilis]
MKLRYKIYSFLFAAAALSGCKKFVDIKTQGNLVPNQTINYRYLLNSTSNLESVSSLSDFASNDIDLTDVAQQSSLSGSQLYSYYTGSYAWQSVLYPLGSAYEQDRNWNSLYNRILLCNTIINELPESNGTKQEKDKLTAEALVHRADAYMNLVNNYAKPYEASTASSDLGVPLVLVQTFSQKLNRATVQVIYSQIIADLTTALAALPATQAYNTLPSKVSAYGELARCYLLMKDYANAAKYADEALKLRSTLNNLGTYTAANMSSYPRRIADPEILLSKVPSDGTVSYSPTAFKLSAEFLSLLGTKDQRYTLFTTDGASIAFGYTGKFWKKEAAIGETRNEGPSVPEMMLIRAEAYARAGDANNAMILINNLRVKRFLPADYIALTASDANDALVKVIEERRREFFGIALRWWDMRRLKNEAAFQRTYTRVFNGVTYTLPPNSNRYVFPIAEYLRQLNPELEQNP